MKHNVFDRAFGHIKATESFKKRTIERLQQEEGRFSENRITKKKTYNKVRIFQIAAAILVMAMIMPVLTIAIYNNLQNMPSGKESPGITSSPVDTDGKNWISLQAEADLSDMKRLWEKDVTVPGLQNAKIILYTTGTFDGARYIGYKDTEDWTLLLASEAGIYSLIPRQTIPVLPQVSSISCDIAAGKEGGKDSVHIFAKIKGPKALQIYDFIWNEGRGAFERQLIYDVTQNHSSQESLREIQEPDKQGLDLSKSFADGMPNAEQQASVELYERDSEWLLSYKLDEKEYLMISRQTQKHNGFTFDTVTKENGNIYITVKYLQNQSFMIYEYFWDAEQNVLQCSAKIEITNVQYLEGFVQEFYIPDELDIPNKEVIDTTACDFNGDGVDEQINIFSGSNVKDFDLGVIPTGWDFGMEVTIDGTKYVKWFNTEGTPYDFEKYTFPDGRQGLFVKSRAETGLTPGTDTGTYFLVALKDGKLEFLPIPLQYDENGNRVKRDTEAGVGFYITGVITNSETEIRCPETGFSQIISTPYSVTNIPLAASDFDLNDCAVIRQDGRDMIQLKQIIHEDTELITFFYTLLSYENGNYKVVNQRMGA